MHVAILSMIYHEPEWLHTVGAIAKYCPVFPTYFAERHGVLGLSQAFNDAFEANHLKHFDYVWFLTNLSFSGPLLQEMLGVLYSMPDKERKKVAAIHPAFKSDHQHLRPRMPGDVLEVPFVEFTAPLVNAEVFAGLKLDPAMPYTGHDIDWGYQARKMGLRLLSYTPKESETQHSYLRHSGSPHPATAERKRRRQEAETATCLRLRNKYGDNWRDLLKYQGGI